MTSDSVPTIAISQPPCTTLARCAVLRKVSTPKLSRDAEPQDERKQPERDRKLREAAQKEPRPNTSLAATMVKKENTRRGSIRSAHRACGKRTARTIVAAISQGNAIALIANCASETGRWSSS
jgi:hypothetical protein